MGSHFLAVDICIHAQSTGNTIPIIDFTIHQFENNPDVIFIWTNDTTNKAKNLNLLITPKDNT